MIQILSGPVRSGKTTSLMRWSAYRHDCGGILSPDVDGFRRLFNVYDKTSIRWQKESAESDTDHLVGRFVFDGHAFRLAEKWLGDHLANPAIQYLLLDEVGPLELSGKGWDAWLKNAIPLIRDKTLVLVVRETLVTSVIETYTLHGAEIIFPDHFKAHP